MKNIKKLGALVLAIMLVAALAVPAFAADLTMTDGVAGAFNTTDKDDSLTVDDDSTIILKKELTAYNPDASDVHAPVINYTYTITQGTAGKDITDLPGVHNSNTSSHVKTKAGPIPGLKITGATNGTANTSVTTAPVGATSVADSIVWNNTGVLHTAADGVANMSDLKLDFSGVTFTGAGVYRYVITEAASAYESNGVVDGNADNIETQIRYLDVYVKDSTAGSYDVYGYVCFEANNSIDATDSSGSEPDVAAAKKSNGFVDTDTSAADASNADKYYTFNVEIKKNLVNDQAKNSNQFPFEVRFANTTVTSNVLLIANGTGTFTAPTPASAALSATVYDGTSATAADQIKIAHNGTVKLIGIPAGTTLTIDEYNNVDGTRYKVTTANGTANTTTAVSLDWNTWASSASGWTTVTAVGGTANSNAKVDTDFTDTTSGKTIVFTNTLEYISPTGIVLRFAPYMLILAAGMALILVSRRRKVEE